MKTDSTTPASTKTTPEQSRGFRNLLAGIALVAAIAVTGCQQERYPDSGAGYKAGSDSKAPVVEQATTLPGRGMTTLPGSGARGTTLPTARGMTTLP